MERFLYRLSQSEHVDKFVLKGALLLTAWRAPLSRPTMDIDLLGRTSNNLDVIQAVIRDVCSVETTPDGIVFDPKTVAVERIKEEADYEGVRVRFRGNLSGARVSMQIDVGFGDDVYPEPQSVEYPTILDFASPVLPAYSAETVVAEKLEAMVKLGPINTRMKDFFDVWLLADLYEFDGKALAESVRRTFTRRETPLEPEPFGLSAAFVEDPTKQQQWQPLRRRARDTAAPSMLPDVATTIRNFTSPILEALTKNWPRLSAGSLGRAGSDMEARLAQNHK